MKKQSNKLHSMDSQEIARTQAATSDAPAVRSEAVEQVRTHPDLVHDQPAVDYREKSDVSAMAADDVLAALPERIAREMVDHSNRHRVTEQWRRIIEEMKNPKAS